MAFMLHDFNNVVKLEFETAQGSMLGRCFLPTKMPCSDINVRVKKKRKINPFFPPSLAYVCECVCQRVEHFLMIFTPSSSAQLYS